jgi:PH domain
LEDQHNGAAAQGTIEFSEMTPVAGVVANAVPTVMTGKANSFGVHTENRTYYICAASADDRGKWIRAITDGHRAHLDRKQGKGKKGTDPKGRTQTESNADGHPKVDIKAGH